MRRPRSLIGTSHAAELLRVLPTDADAEDHAPVGDAVEVGDLLGHERGWIERQEQDRRADLHPLGQRGRAGRGSSSPRGSGCATRRARRPTASRWPRPRAPRSGARSPPATSPMRISSLVAGRGQWSTSARRARSSGESPRSVSSTSSLSWPMSGPCVTAQSRSEKSHGARITRVRPISGCSMSTKTPRAATCGSFASASFVMTAIAGTPAACSVSNASREERRRVHALTASSMTSPAARRASAVG